MSICIYVHTVRVHWLRAIALQGQPSLLYALMMHIYIILVKFTGVLS